MNLKSSVEKLKATALHIEGNFCLVIHGDDCCASKIEAVAKFIAMHGYEPKNFINIFSLARKRSREFAAAQTMKQSRNGNNEH